MDPLNLILLIIVVLVGLRLRSVLGMRDEDEQPGRRKDAYRLNRDAFKSNAETKAETKSNIKAGETTRDLSGDPSGDLSALPQADETPAGMREDTAAADSANDIVADIVADAETRAPMGESDGRGLAFLRASEPDFDEADFLDGAARAYEMILTAFADGTLEEVSGFLGDDVAAGFAAAIATRQDNEQQLVTRILRLDRPALDDARLDAALVSVDVRFRAELISFTCPLGAVIEEDALPAPVTTHDVWTFARPRGATDPNWSLVATHSA